MIDGWYQVSFDEWCHAIEKGAGGKQNLMPERTYIISKDRKHHEYINEEGRIHISKWGILSKRKFYLKVVVDLKEIYANT